MNILKLHEFDKSIMTHFQKASAYSTWYVLVCALHTQDDATHNTTPHIPTTNHTAALLSPTLQHMHITEEAGN